jgi:D-alanyl-D-alanine carboxypeptidase (penicillin-binding protein 5/6)
LLVAPRNIAVTIPAGPTSNMRVKVVYNGPIKAPIKAGQHVADLVVQTGDTPPQRMPLVAAAEIEEAGFFGRLWAGVASLFA